MAGLRLRVIGYRQQLGQLLLGHLDHAGYGAALERRYETIPAMDAGSLQPVVGRCLSAVCFVMDYVQVNFEDAVLTVLNPLTVSAGGNSWTRGEAGWRDALCSCIGRTVSGVVRTEGDLMINLDDASTLRVSLLSEDFVGPEAFNFTSPGSPTIVG